MSNHPVNLAVRFFLELAALFAIGYAGWTQNDGILRPLIGLGLPVFAAVMWGVFRYPNDPGKPPVEVSGPVRLLLEAVFFGLAVILLASAGHPIGAAILGIMVVLNYAASYDRVRHLLRGEPVESPQLL